MAKNHPMGTIETRVDSRMSQSVDLDYPVAAASALPKVPWRPHCARVPTPRVFDRRKKLPFLKNLFGRIDVSSDRDLIPRCA